jgi:hypothetical protein
MIYLAAFVAYVLLVIFTRTYREIANIEGNSLYLRRWSFWLLIVRRGPSIKVHQILRADDDRCLHDHPWWMLRIIIKGGYTEVCGDSKVEVFRRPGSIAWSGKNFKHRIVSLANGKDPWTIALMGSNHDDWGFYTLDGRMPWREFVHLAQTARVLWCADGRALTNEVRSYGKEEVRSEVREGVEAR